METIDVIKNRLVDKVKATQNRKVLELIDQIFEISQTTEKKEIEFSAEQIELISMAEDDIRYGRIISQEELDEKDRQWKD